MKDGWTRGPTAAEMMRHGEEQVVIRVEHLAKRYDDVVAVDDLSFEVGAEELFGLLGRNGAGREPRSASPWTSCGRTAAM